MRVLMLNDVMGLSDSAEIVCLYKKEVVRTLTKEGGNIHIEAGDGSSVDLPIDTLVTYKEFFMDRGSMLLGNGMKLCTELDIVRYPDGTEYPVHAPEGQGVS